MTSSNNDLYNLKVLPGTRDHHGFFIQETTYKLAGMTSSGWARICLDSAACYYVSPDSFLEISGGSEDFTGE
ncbi:MAG: hypothetical protein ICV62_03105 [Cyanobacteria bacterium Co-bin13]|nr:hypothetical protein [Cyanobacteria bacterium Co-bin13]